MPSVLLAFAAVLTRSVYVQATVIVLPIKCATQLTTSATLVVCLMGNLAQQKMVLNLILAVLLAYAAVLTRFVFVQVTVIVLRTKHARLLQMNAWYPLTGFMLFVLLLVKVMRVLVQECHLMF